MKSPRLGTLAILVALSIASAASGQERILVLQGGTLIDGTGRPPIADAVVVVAGGRIRAVGRRGEVAIPDGATVMQTDGRTILPGLVDMHLHTRPWKIPLYLAHGVTTVGDIHNDTQWILGQRALLKSGIIQGPRLFVSGARVTGLNGPRLINAAGEIVEDPSFVKTPAEARAYVRYLHTLGADFVKVDATITDEQLASVIDESWKLGMPVLGHLQNIDTAMSFGMKEMEHLPPFFRAQLIREGKPLPKPGPQEQLELARAVDTGKFSPLITKMVEQGVIVDVALYNWVQPVIWPAVRAEVERLAKDPGLAFVPGEEKAAWVREPGPPSEAYKIVVAFLQQYVAAGGKILVSTDGIERSAIVPGLGLHVVMQGVEKMGIPAMTVIQAATLWPAQALGIDKDYGSVEAGKSADFVIVDGNPLADVTAARRIRTVIMNGTIVNTKYDPNWVNPLPRPKDAVQP
ncbi:MAG: amidohydrolase family protein [Vicinamibacterales bacterium]